jgi:hypothetical protein
LGLPKQIGHKTDRFLDRLSNVRHQPRRLIVAPAAVGCMPC